MLVVLTILISFITIFLESFFVALGNFKIFALLSLGLFNKINWKYIVIFTVISSLALDVVFHFVLGTNLLVVAIILVLNRLVAFLVPVDYSIAGYSVKSISMFLYYILIAVVPSLLSEGHWGYIDGVFVWGAILKSAISLALLILFDIGWSRLRKKEDASRLRLA